MCSDGIGEDGGRGSLSESGKASWVFVLTGIIRIEYCVSGITKFVSTDSWLDSSACKSNNSCGVIC